MLDARLTTVEERKRFRIKMFVRENAKRGLSVRRVRDEKLIMHRQLIVEEELVMVRRQLVVQRR